MLAQVSEWPIVWVAKQAPALCLSAHPLLTPARVCSPTTQAKAAAAAAQLQRRKWNLLRSKFGFEIAHSCPGITTCQQHELMLSVSSLHLLPRSRSRALRHRNPFLKCFPSKRICLPLQAAAASRASSSMPTNRDHEIYNYTSGRWL